MDKNKLLRKVKGLTPNNRSTESLTEEEKKRYKREVGIAPNERSYYVSAKKNIQRRDIEMQATRRIVGKKEEDRALPEEVKRKVQQVRRTLKPSR